MITATDSKPTLFVGSSNEGLEVARAVEFQLSDTTEVTIWKDGPFGLNSGNLEALVRASDQYDFAVLVLTPDDLVTSREVTSQAPRDNVMFELGLFMGRLGRDRCFAMSAESSGMKLPSDLAGVTIARYQNDRRDGNWVSAVSPACTLIRNEIARLGRRIPLRCEGKHDSPAAGNDVTKPEVSIDALETRGLAADEWTVSGVIKRPFTGWFHNERFCAAFPGVRGTERIDNPTIAIDRLRILLAKPLHWIAERDNGDTLASSNPIWWWRGLSNNPIGRFESLGDNVVLRDEDELNIRFLVAVNSNAYWQSFVYVETSPSVPSDVYEYDAEYVEKRFKEYGPVSEEYGVWQGTRVTRAEYDDGAAVIEGVPRRIEGVELRIRYLTANNFLIAAQDSPINNSEFDPQSLRLMNGILYGTRTVDELISAILELPKSRYCG